eukprot:11365389-Alexandrium_andersonii.AAC.1
MSASLVGSEMCIRDSGLRCCTRPQGDSPRRQGVASSKGHEPRVHAVIVMHHHPPAGLLSEG